MLLRVGELARRAGLTVRTLHHYDEIGLLQPSGRSASGYRLYSQADVQRLHAIQTLRHLGLALADIAGLLADGGVEPERIIAQQIRALDQQIAQATELRGRLALLQSGLAAGAVPDTGHWLDTLALMTTYGKYFSAAELKRIFGHWKRIEADLAVLRGQVRGAMDRGLPAHAPEVQALAYRWMALMLHWMDNDLDLLERWGHMFRTEPSTQGRHHAPPGDMIAFIEAAIQLRQDAIAKYMDKADVRKMGYVPHAQWVALERDVQRLIDCGVPPSGRQALAAARRWRALFNTLTRNDLALQAKLAAASAQEPLLRSGLPLSAPVRGYLQSAHLTLTQREAS
jgi:DNA-binding transcriptional MerR regulator